jgi:Pyridoxamine 5'-phosphate oxidase
MMNWADLERGAPDLAGIARDEFARSGMALVGTLRKDGSPRISNVEPVVADGELYLGMMWQSRKAVDLQRDPRLVLRNAVCTNTGKEVELIIRGRAVAADDDGTRRKYVEHSDASWGERQFHLFAVEIESVALIRYGAGKQYVNVWPRGTEFSRTY